MKRIFKMGLSFTLVLIIMAGTSLAGLNGSTDSCVTIKDDLSLVVPCADFSGNKFKFNLLPYKNPQTPFDPNLYWMLDLGSFGTSLIDSYDKDIPINATPPAPQANCTSVSSTLKIQIEQTLNKDAALAAELLDPEKISVVTVGTGTPMGTSRVQPCIAVFVNGKFLLFDAGDGAMRAMESQGLPMINISDIFITHFHSDHMADIGEVISRSWILGRNTPLTIYGGVNINRIVEGFNLVYTLDEAYRIAHHGETVFSPGTMAANTYTIETLSENGVAVYDQNGVRILAYKVDHSPVTPSFAFRIEYANKSVVISGDTINTPGLRNAVNGADMVVFDVMNKSFIEAQECAFRNLGEERTATLMKDIRAYHIDVNDVAMVAKNGGVRKLILIHQTPAVDIEAMEKSLFLDPIASLYSGEVVVAKDGDIFTINAK
ncbi:MAG: MBL fold metallo-hydrolase [Planctomycetes bacterium]|nr:MBL fold metallo-hydrolase [Planctomycetota bacterium]